MCRRAVDAKSVSLHMRAGLTGCGAVGCFAATARPCQVKYNLNAVSPPMMRRMFASGTHCLKLAIAYS